MRNSTDNQLVELYCEKNDSQALAEIYNRYKIVIFRFIYSRVGNSDLANDILSETFLAFMDLAQKFDQKSKLTTFIIGIAFNKIRQSWDRAKIMQEYSLEGGIEEFSDTVVEEEYITKSLNLLEYLPKILAELKPDQRNVLTERFINNCSIKETAQKMQISESNVTTLCSRAIANATKIANLLILNLNEK